MTRKGRVTYSELSKGTSVVGFRWPEKGGTVWLQPKVQRITEKGASSFLLFYHHESQVEEEAHEKTEEEAPEDETEIQVDRTISPSVIRGEKHGAQEPCTVVPISYVYSESTVYGIDIDFNAAPETDIVSDDVYDSSDLSDHDVDSDSDPNVDKVPDDIDDKGVNNDGNINASSVGNQFDVL
ncbi:hypothetical protein J1N35_011879 [Gossypium stocksii]|uniref:Uncharacterized protein n=1 Tax=Gossypium stocksii TaxID=47602 RepID=A0A9D3W3I3_9ROSI|nr:hypothetical protein J1N35_011879 [Gossypium stocksii]